jgi:hypothetical protein
MVMCVVVRDTLNNIFYYCFTLEKLPAVQYRDSRPVGEGRAS